jgi:hypothetical protein
MSEQPPSHAVQRILHEGWTNWGQELDGENLWGWGSCISSEPIASFPPSAKYPVKLENCPGGKLTLFLISAGIQTYTPTTGRPSITLSLKGVGVHHYALPLHGLFGLDAEYSWRLPLLLGTKRRLKHRRRCRSTFAGFSGWFTCGSPASV